MGGQPDAPPRAAIDEGDALGSGPRALEVRQPRVRMIHATERSPSRHWRARPLEVAAVTR
jgi:hypothetical protein